ncbi:MAG: hypothetical protein ACM3PY_08060, partial [Omnitrophica WOR_2 bacterium]
MKRLPYQPPPIGAATYLVKPIILLLIALGIAGCKPYNSRDQNASSSQITLEAGTTLGQTFLAQYSGLNGFEVRLAPLTSGQGNLILHIRGDSQSPDDIAVAQLPIKRVKNLKFYPFSFLPQQNSSRHYYYAFIEVQGSGAVQVSAAPGSAYLNGALYRDGSPLNNQMAFSLAYDPAQVALGISREVLDWLLILAAGIFLFVLPGWGFLSFFWPGWEDLAWAGRLGLSAGLSLALYPVLLLWTNLVGLHLGGLYAWIPALSGSSMLVWKYRKGFN